ncbi:hypothetical protein PGT21_035003 [Puccinia graminis f. sp. tritici]|uniref:Uncharacterized protein n=1 Tax=Puccinia graminis f. sp. tritici TaxID=56615 RepID=A0A5B0SL25_PUCGR|nr:hypothetical protein PGT21_035003 [Puccinia graminis f. sp. tritici]KAA1138265.1 hypothetical protein PGTUg99_027943 [Puccinia graminis f. sp. tritici]
MTKCYLAISIPPSAARSLPGYAYIQSDWKQRTQFLKEVVTGGSGTTTTHIIPSFTDWTERRDHLERNKTNWSRADLTGEGLIDVLRKQEHTQQSRKTSAKKRKYLEDVQHDFLALDHQQGGRINLAKDIRRGPAAPADFERLPRPRWNVPWNPCHHLQALARPSIRGRSRDRRSRDIQDELLPDSHRYQVRPLHFSLSPIPFKITLQNLRRLRRSAQGPFLLGRKPNQK